jgi:hypothetical protein
VFAEVSSRIGSDGIGRGVVRLMLPGRFEGPYFVSLQGFFLLSSAPEGEGPAVLRSAGKRPGTQGRGSEDLYSNFHQSLDYAGNITWK